MPSDDELNQQAASNILEEEVLNAIEAVLHDHYVSNASLIARRVVKELNDKGLSIVPPGVWTESNQCGLTKDTT